MTATDGTVPVVVITGPIGVGKTATTVQLGDLLSDAGIPHTAIDMDWLRATHPRPVDDRFNARLGHRNLADVARNSRKAGSERFVIADVVESRRDRENYCQAIPGAEVMVVRLTADMDTIRARIAHRASGDDDPWEVERAAELIAIMDANDVADVLIDTTGRTPREVASQIADRLGWLPDAIT